MSKKTSKYGHCVICGKYKKLTKEHVPPKKAFNNHRYSINLIKDSSPFSEPIRKKYQQGGISFFTLCEKCNNNTGSWYADAYVDWCLFGMDILRRSKGKPSLHYFNKIYPLRIIKQIIVMMFSLNENEFREINPYLERFVLNKELNHLPDEYDVYVYYNLEGHPRYHGYTALSQNGKMSVFCEFTYPPYGFVLTLQNMPPPNNRMTKITYFSDFQYDTEWDIDLCINPLATWLGYIPGDYRSKEEIQKALIKDTK